MEAIALYDYYAKSPQELNFKAFDVLKVIDEESDSNWVMAILYGIRGRVPVNYLSFLPRPWYFRKIDRQTAETVLQSRAVGIFLVRSSENTASGFSVSVRGSTMVKHFSIDLDVYGRFYVWNKVFESINDLLDYYHFNIIDQDEPLRLKNPASYGFFVQTIYNFEGSADEGLLPFRTNQIIDVIESSRHWWLGRIGHRCGYFPSNYVVQAMDFSNYNVHQ